MGTELNEAVSHYSANGTNRQNLLTCSGPLSRNLGGALDGYPVVFPDLRRDPTLIAFVTGSGTVDVNYLVAIVEHKFSAAYEGFQLQSHFATEVLEQLKVKYTSKSLWASVCNPFKKRAVSVPVPNGNGTGRGRAGAQNGTVPVPIIFIRGTLRRRKFCQLDEHSTITV